MAQTMKRVALLALLALSGAVQAQSADPTRPPAVMTAPAATGSGAEVVVRSERREPQLQSILVSLRPGGRRIAVIDGKMVRQGQRVGDAVVLSIGSGEVVLRRGARNQTLKLFRPATRVATVQP